MNFFLTKLRSLPHPVRAGTQRKIEIFSVSIRGEVSVKSLVAKRRDAKQ